MPDNTNLQNVENTSAFIKDDDAYNKTIQVVPKKERGIGIDTNAQIYQNIIDAAESGTLDMTKIESFLRMSQSREEVYELLDTMSEDSIVSAILETYAEDATETNEEGQIVWAMSDDENVQKFVSYLLDTMRVDKHIYGWVYSLCKYGDVYLRLYKESEFNDILFNDLDKKKETLNEDVKVKIYKETDKYVHYLEQVPNPAEMFELTKFGKSYAYIEAPVGYSRDKDTNYVYGSVYNYQFNRNDVTVFNATNFVHACLDDNSSRTPEEVTLFITDDSDEEATVKATYKVKRGQSLLYSSFKIWREMMLLENAMLLNRITKSSLFRVINVEVGDMPKEQVSLTLNRLKQKFEQKTALNSGISMSEYNNPGPVENIIYVPTRGGIGNISTQQIGGDVDVNGLADVDYFKNRFFGAMRVPKQFFGDTDDSAGFDGGTSLSIISSRYAKMVKRVQNTILQALTDAVNIMLLDKGLNSYVNKFTLHMLEPATKEVVDRNDAVSSRVQLSSDILNMLDGVEDPIAKLKITKLMVSKLISDADVLEIIQQEIDRLETEQEETDNPTPDTGGDDSDIDMDMDIDFNGPSGGGSNTPAPDFVDNIDMGNEGNQAEREAQAGAETILPTPSQLNPDMDFTSSEGSEI